MKKILFIATGGTIASKPENGLLTPRITPEELIEYVPELKKLCSITAIQPFNKDSTNANYDDWFEVAKIIEANYQQFDGFVIAHGTDTMAYASAALSYFIQNNAKPVVITGSQKSIYLRDTDARANLLDAFIFASDKRAHGTHIVFDGKIILGTRARKTRTKSSNAFSSIDYPEIGWIISNKIKYFITPSVKGEVLFAKKIDKRVAVIKLIPGISADILSYLIGKVKAVIIESFGVGGLPYYNNNDFIHAIKALKDSGIKIIMTTQVPHEGSDMEVYKVGAVKKQLELIEAHDMTLEAIVGKAVWALGIDDDFEKLFTTPIAHDTI